MIDGATLRRVYRSVTFARHLDERVQALLDSGAALTTWFSWRGTEVLGSVVGLAMRPDDYLISYYRDTASQLAKGASAAAMCAEVLGKATGSQKGKSGWVHTVDPPATLGNSGVIGGALPIAAGWALSSVIRGDDRVTVCTFGDGATDEGAFHEALNLASIWNLPVVYVCFNNMVAEHTAFQTTSPVAHVADRAAAYAIPGVTVDTSDFVATWETVNAAIDRARSGAGPTLVEAMVGRPRGHTRYDASIYLHREVLVQAQAGADPVPVFRAWLVTEGHLSEDELAAMDQEAADEAIAAWQFAEDSPYPELSELYTDVYATA